VFHRPDFRHGGRLEARRKRPAVPRPACEGPSGRVVADVEQACVVTLEPVAERIEAELSVLLRPAARRQDDALDITDPFDEDEVEEIESGTIDVGRIVYEEIASRLDPYPRAPGADFDWKDEAASESDEEKENPFAKLAALRKEDPQK